MNTLPITIAVRIAAQPVRIVNLVKHLQEITRRGDDWLEIDRASIDTVLGSTTTEEIALKLDTLLKPFGWEVSRYENGGDGPYAPMISDTSIQLHRPGRSRGDSGFTREFNGQRWQC